MALPSHLAGYDSLIDLLVGELVREITNAGGEKDQAGETLEETEVINKDSAGRSAA